MMSGVRLPLSRLGRGQALRRKPRIWLSFLLLDNPAGTATPRHTRRFCGRPTVSKTVGGWVRLLPGVPRDAVNLRPVRIHTQTDGIPHPTCDGGVVPLRFYGHLLPSHVTAFVAQRTERPPPKREATGSIPVEGTRFHVIRRERSGMAPGRFTGVAGCRHGVQRDGHHDIFTGDADA